MNNILYFGRYEGWRRWLARGVRDGDAECITKAAQLFDLMLPDKCAVVPMPSHGGRATTMLRVAEQVCDLRPTRALCDVLACEPHESSYDLKKSGAFPKPFKMSVLDYGICSYIPKDTYIIDNVVCTGTTAGAALRALPFAHVCALAISHWR